LKHADLGGADLTGINLIGADLTGARGDFVLGYLGKDHAIAAGGYISIGDLRYRYLEWMTKAYSLLYHKCSKFEIKLYEHWIDLAVKTLDYRKEHYGN
jgi:hypothetical protein